MAPATPCSRRSRRRSSAACAPPTWSRASAATNSPCCYGTSTAPMPPPKPARSKPLSMERRCAGALRRWWSAPPPALCCSARSIRPPTLSPAPTRRCMRARMSGRASPPCPCARRRSRSRNNIRRELVFDEGDAVAQLQLALLQALHLDDVGARRLLQRRNRGVEVAMLLLQARQLRPKLAFFLFRHRRLGRAVVALDPPLGAV